MSMLAASTRDPPCEQLLTGVGAGAGSSVVVWRSLCSLISPLLPSSCRGARQCRCLLLAPAIHPASSCSQAWRQVLDRLSWLGCAAATALIATITTIAWPSLTCHHRRHRTALVLPSIVVWPVSTHNPPCEQWLTGEGRRVLLLSSCWWLRGLGGRQ
jgi:hypothetical protein